LPRAGQLRVPGKHAGFYSLLENEIVVLDIKNREGSLLLGDYYSLTR
jgi:hypothetical protein